MTVPEGFTLGPVDVIIPTTPENYTTVMIPHSGAIQFHDSNCHNGGEPGTEDSRSHAVPYVECCTLYGIMDCIGYTSLLTHEGHDSTIDMGTFFVYKLYKKRVTVFNREYIGQVFLQLQECTWTLSTTEQASGIFYKLTGHITNLCRNYIILQHIIIPIEKVLNGSEPPHLSSGTDHL